MSVLWVRRLALVLLAWSIAWGLLAVVAALFGAGHAGQFLASDFTCFWAAGRLAARGLAAASYRPDVLWAVEQTARSIPAQVGFLPFYYPPPFLVVCAGLALLPYWPALLVFLAGGGLVLALALRRLLPSAMGWLPVLAYPGFLITARNGQNSFLAAACFAWFAVLADTRPFLAGMCLGGLAYKPHLAPAAPLALLAARRGRCLAGVFAGYVALAVLSLLFLGMAPWLAFFQHAGDMAATLNGGLHVASKTIATFGAMRLLGAGFGVAWAAQGLVDAVVLCALLAFAWRRPAGPALAAAVTVASLVLTPYALDYDLIIVAPALAVAACGTGGAWRNAVLAAAFTLPVYAQAVAIGAGVQAAPLVLGALFFAITLREGKGQKDVHVFATAQVGKASGRKAR